MYGAMLWRLNRKAFLPVNQVLEHLCEQSHQHGHCTVRWLACPHTSLREDLLTRWTNLYQSLQNSSSPEVATIASVAAGDLRTTTGGNNYLITKLGLSASNALAAEVREKMTENDPKESEEQMDRIGCCWRCWSSAMSTTTPARTRIMMSTTSLIF